MSRFSGWIVGQCTSDQGRTQFYEPVLRELLRRILDRSRRVQEAACSAFSTLEEQATEQELVPYLPVILNHLTRALRLYRNKNLRLLYDTIGTLAESVGSSLNEPACIAVLMPPLISRWNGLEDTDSDLFPLLGVTCKKKNYNPLLIFIISLVLNRYCNLFGNRVLAIYRTSLCSLRNACFHNTEKLNSIRRV